MRTLVLLLAAAACWGHPLANRVLVVYDSSVSDSVAMANYYKTARGIPGGNLCALTLGGIGGSSASQTLTNALWTSLVKTPIQNCLTTLGPGNILYIVYAYVLPYTLFPYGAGTSGPIESIDSFTADIWDQYLPAVPNAEWNPATMTTPLFPPSFQPYYQDYSAQNATFSNFVPFRIWRAENPTQLIYSVWRLDGETLALAEGEVSNAIATEAAGGIAGHACIDLTGSVSGTTDDGDNSPAGVNWDLWEAYLLFNSSIYPVTVDTNGAEFGTSPAPLTCGDTAFYSGWYSLDNYNGAGVFAWQPGSVGWHIDSASMANPRAGTPGTGWGNNWGGNAIINGITATTGVVNEPYDVGNTRPAGTFRDLLMGANVGDAIFANTRYIKWMNINVGDPLYTPVTAGRYSLSNYGTLWGAGKIRGLGKLH